MPGVPAKKPVPVGGEIYEVAKQQGSRDPGFKDSSEMLKNYKELTVWQKAYYLCLDIYKITKRFPMEEKYGLTSQVRRAAVSVPSNIAEGYGRQHTSEYVRFLQIARGSLNELITQLEIARSLDYLQDIGDTIRECDEIGRMLNTLIKKLSNSSNK